MDWPQIALLIIQALLTIVVGWISLKQKKTLDKFTVEQEFMLELSKPYYSERKNANQEVYSAIYKAYSDAITFESVINEFNHFGYSIPPGWSGRFNDLRDIISTLVDFPYNQLNKTLESSSSYLHTKTQNYVESFMSFYQVFFNMSKAYLLDQNKPLYQDFSNLNNARVLLLKSMQELFDRIDILNSKHK